jgi:hypothetical protein
MAEKPGRNAPCPCGSGKKYKKCCMDKDEQERFNDANREFEESLTGTPLDEYFMLFRMLLIYAEKVRMTPGEDGKEFDRGEKDFIRDFKPGQDRWLPESFLNNWLIFDFRFGYSGKTVCERFMEAEPNALVEPGPENLKIISGSYFTFYSVMATTQKELILSDLYNGKKWIMEKLGGEGFEERAKPGEIWFTRLVGVPERCYNASTPYVFDPDARENFTKALQGRVASYMAAKDFNGPVTEHIYAESCKESLRLWARYMLVSSKTVSVKGEPILTNADMDEYERKQKQILKKHPEMKQMISGHLKEYYLTDWINSPIPALLDERPVDAVKTKKGMKATADLIDFMEKMQKDSHQEGAFDFDTLRKKLGIKAAGKSVPKKTGKPAAAVKSGSVYILEVEILDIEPKIWRAFAVKESTTLEDLAYIIITSFGWHGGHLHGFYVGPQEYGMLDTDDTGELEEEGMLDEGKAKLMDLPQADLKKFIFTYDFGDNWDHEIRLKKTEGLVPGVKYPLCLGGARNAPPEDCGSVPGYYEVLDALKNRKKPTKEQKERLDWLEDGYDPEYFNLNDVNENLKHIKQIIKQFKDLM